METEVWWDTNLWNKGRDSKLTRRLNPKIERDRSLAGFTHSPCLLTDLDNNNISDSGSPGIRKIMKVQCRR